MKRNLQALPFSLPAVFRSLALSPLARFFSSSTLSESLARATLLPRSFNDKVFGGGGGGLTLGLKADNGFIFKHCYQKNLLIILIFYKSVHGKYQLALNRCNNIFVHFLHYTPDKNSPPHQRSRLSDSRFRQSLKSTKAVKNQTYYKKTTRSRV